MLLWVLPELPNSCLPTTNIYMIHKIKDIELADISRYRGELMGVAMIAIILFHVSLPRSDMFYGLRRMGNIGVDIFLFLSGMGLWFSWVKNQSVKRFFTRRYLRIYPTWLVVAGLFYGCDFFGTQRYSKDIVDLLGDVLINWDFWLHDEGTFWYIPATMMLYIFTPAYMTLIRRNPVYRWMPALMMVWCVAVQWVAPIHSAVGHIEIFWSRIPIYLIGINMGEAVRNKTILRGSSIWLIALFFIASLSTCVYLEQVLHGRFPLFIERMVYIPLTITGILLFCRLFAVLPEKLNKGLAFIGTISLEIYLIHAHFILCHIEKLKLGYWPTFIICVAIAFPIAWVLGKIMKMITNPIEKRLK